MDAKGASDPTIAPRPHSSGGAHLSRPDAALALSVVILWGYNFVPIKVALNEVPAFALAALRFTLAAIPWLFFVRRPHAPWRLVMAYGLAIGVGQFGLLFLAIRLGMPAGLSSLVAQAQVFITIALGAALFKDAIKRIQLIGTLVAAAGLLVLALSELRGGTRATLLGFFFVLAAATSWAAGNVIAKWTARNHDANMFSLVVWSSLAAPLPLAICSYTFEGGHAPAIAVAEMSPKAWASVLFMTYGATLFGFAAWNKLLHRYSTALVSPFALLIPVAGLASGAMFLGESLAPLQLLGAALVLLGLAVTILRVRKLVSDALPEDCRTRGSPAPVEGVPAPGEKKLQ